MSVDRFKFSDLNGNLVRLITKRLNPGTFKKIYMSNRSTHSKLKFIKNELITRLLFNRLFDPIMYVISDFYEKQLAFEKVPIGMHYPETIDKFRCDRQKTIEYIYWILDAGFAISIHQICRIALFGDINLLNFAIQKYADTEVRFQSMSNSMRLGYHNFKYAIISGNAACLMRLYYWLNHTLVTDSKNYIRSNFDVLDTKNNLIFTDKDIEVALSKYNGNIDVIKFVLLHTDRFDPEYWNTPDAEGKNKTVSYLSYNYKIDWKLIELLTDLQSSLQTLYCFYTFVIENSSLDVIKQLDEYVQRHNILTLEGTRYAEYPHAKMHTLSHVIRTGNMDIIRYFFYKGYNRIKFKSISDDTVPKIGGIFRALIATNNLEIFKYVTANLELSVDTEFKYRKGKTLHEDDIIAFIESVRDPEFKYHIREKCMIYDAINIFTPGDSMDLIKYLIEYDYVKTDKLLCSDRTETDEISDLPSVNNTDGNTGNTANGNSIGVTTNIDSISTQKFQNINRSRKSNAKMFYTAGDDLTLLKYLIDVNNTSEAAAEYDSYVNELERSKIPQKISKSKIKNLSFIGNLFKIPIYQNNIPGFKWMLEQGIGFSQKRYKNFILVNVIKNGGLTMLKFLFDNRYIDHNFITGDKDITDFIKYLHTIIRSSALGATIWLVQNLLTTIEAHHLLYAINFKDGDEMPFSYEQNKICLRMLDILYTKLRDKQQFLDEQKNYIYIESMNIEKLKWIYNKLGSKGVTKSVALQLNVHCFRHYDTCLLTTLITDGNFYPETMDPDYKFGKILAYNQAVAAYPRYVEDMFTTYYENYKFTVTWIKKYSSSELCSSLPLAEYGVGLGLTPSN